MQSSMSIAPMATKLNSDRNVWWRPGRLYRPAYNMQGLFISTNLVSLGTGTSTIQALNSTEFASLHMAATGNTVADFIEVPYDMDLTKNVYFSVDWCASGTSGSCQWVVSYTKYIVGTTVISANPATALDTVVPNQTTNAVAYTLTRSSEGTLGANKLDKNVEFLGIELKCTLTTLSSVELMGYTIRYTPKRMYYGDGAAHESKNPQFITAGNY